MTCSENFIRGYYNLKFFLVIININQVIPGENIITGLFLYFGAPYEKLFNSIIHENLALITPISSLQNPLKLYKH